MSRVAGTASSGKPPQAIPTTYGEIEFRSRLEATWAAFFDLVGWAWEYEPFSLATRYTPDFMIRGPEPVLVEVRPATTFEDYLTEYKRMWLRRINEYDGHVVLVGTSPVPESRTVSGQVRNLHCNECTRTWDAGHEGLVAGLYVHGPSTWEDEPWYVAWARCTPDDERCDQLAWYHPRDAYQALPCGHWDGDHHLGQMDWRALEMYWRRARNATRWRP